MSSLAPIDIQAIMADTLTKVHELAAQGSRDHINTLKRVIEEKDSKIDELTAIIRNLEEQVGGLRAREVHTKKRMFKMLADNIEIMEDTLPPENGICPICFRGPMTLNTQGAYLMEMQCANGCAKQYACSTCMPQIRTGCTSCRGPMVPVPVQPAQAPAQPAPVPAQPAQAPQPAPEAINLFDTESDEEEPEDGEIQEGQDPDYAPVSPRYDPNWDQETE